MSQREEVYRWRDVIRQHMSGLSKPQACVLSLFSLGMLLARRCNLRAVAEKLGSMGKPDTVERRLQRFLGNQRLDWSWLCTQLSAWLLGSLPSSSPIVLLVDETSLQEHLKVMTVALAYRGRALPLAWWCYPNRQWPLRQVELIDRLLTWVQRAIPPGRQVLVQADRGIGTSPELLDCLERRGWNYLMRVQSQVRLVLPTGKEVAFGTLLTRVGGRFHARVKAFKKASWRELWALASWKAGNKEPWLLVSNCAWARSYDYALRMWEEEAFRDLKSNGFHWQRSRVRKPEHANLLWLVMSLSYAYAISHGSYARSHKKLLRQVIRGKVTRHSLFRIGLRLLQYWLDSGIALLNRLFLIRPATRLKSVV